MMQGDVLGNVFDVGVRETFGAATDSAQQVVMVVAVVADPIEVRAAIPRAAAR